jgi:hypothetical protein
MGPRFLGLLLPLLLPTGGAALALNPLKVSQSAVASLPSPADVPSAESLLIHARERLRRRDIAGAQLLLVQAEELRDAGGTISQERMVLFEHISARLSLTPEPGFVVDAGEPPPPPLRMVGSTGAERASRSGSRSGQPVALERPGRGSVRIVY